MAARGHAAGHACSHGRRGRPPLRPLLLLAALLAAAAQINVSTYDELRHAVVDLQAPAVRVVAHISYAAAGDSINVSAPLSLFGDTAACRAGAAALDASLFSADPTTFTACTLDGAGQPWRHLTVTAVGDVNNFTDLRRARHLCSAPLRRPRADARRRPRSFIYGGATSLDAGSNADGGVASSWDSAGGAAPPAPR